MSKARRVAVAFAVLALGWTTIDARPESEPTRRQLAADGVTLVTIEAGARRVEVEGWAESRVVADTGADVELAVERRGARLTVDAAPGTLSAPLRVRVPADVRVEISTTSGAVEVAGLTGSVSIETLSGALRIVDRPAEVKIDTVGGTVSLLDGAGRVEIETVGGAVDLRGRMPRARVDSVSAAIGVHPSAPIERLEIEAVTGRVDIVAALAAGARVDIESHAGAVHLDLPADTSARIEASTYAGTFGGDWSGVSEQPGEPGDEHRRVLVLGDGAAHVEVETYAGSIVLKRDR